ncbi:hypothetical protein KC19_5G097500 [Ceratodon purpureus]|uniref:Secreted protein n=1 Tax=Ceratodon purpureus TaxID=3225 RepID=A0A8T0HZR8_CERPU|nr:hypothetical protein KC19_5G097500 [Ceratodon purpureus]
MLRSCHSLKTLFFSCLKVTDTFEGCTCRRCGQTGSLRELGVHGITKMRSGHQRSCTRWRITTGVRNN